MPEDNTKWYAISVIPRKEKVTSQTLRAKGYEEFLPLYTEKRPWSDRLKAVELPLFPGYVFCRLDPQFRLPILKIPSINQIIGFGKTPHPIDDAEVASLQTVCKAGIHAVPCPYLTAGAKVNILEGPLKGVEGILVQDAVQTSDPRLVVSVTLLQRSISVEIDRDWISPLRIYTEFARE
jgi:transcription antitermination factor NusG